jgi:hypothetical protein
LTPPVWDLMKCASIAAWALETVHIGGGGSNKYRFRFGRQCGVVVEHGWVSPSWWFVNIGKVVSD